jgi:hypothetical protein
MALSRSSEFLCVSYMQAVSIREKLAAAPGIEPGPSVTLIGRKNHLEMGDLAFLTKFLHIYYTYIL